MKEKLLISLFLFMALISVFGCKKKTSKAEIELSEEFADNYTIEYNGKDITLPYAVVKRDGKTISYDVSYVVKDENGKTYDGEGTPTFTLSIGSYTIVYSYGNTSIEKTFKVVDTTAPVITFSNIPSNLFFEEGMSKQSLPDYDISDFFFGSDSTEEQKLYFTDVNGEKSEIQIPITNKYTIPGCGLFEYTVTVKDDNGNTSTASCSWKVKDTSWEDPSLDEGYLSDFNEEGYYNYISSANIGGIYNTVNAISEEYVASYLDASGLMKLTSTFNQNTNSSGESYASFRIQLAKSFSLSDLEGKYLVIRMNVEGTNVSEKITYAGNNVVDSSVTGDTYDRCMLYQDKTVEEGIFKEYYISFETASYLKMENEEGNIEYIQFAIARTSPAMKSVTVYLDSIYLAEKLDSPVLSVADGNVSWNNIENADYYEVDDNGVVSTTSDTSYSVSSKGLIKVTAKSSSPFYLDSTEERTVYGLNVKSGYASEFNDALYEYLFDDDITFLKDSADNANYIPTGYTYTTNEGKSEIVLKQGNAGIVSAIRLKFAVPVEKEEGAILLIKLKLSDNAYKTLRIYDFDNYERLLTCEISNDQVGNYITLSYDLSNYSHDTLFGLNLVFGTGGNSFKSGLIIDFDSILVKTQGMDSIDNSDSSLRIKLNEDVLDRIQMDDLSITSDGTTLSGSLDGGYLTVDTDSLTKKDGCTIHVSLDSETVELDEDFVFVNGKFYVLKKTFSGDFGYSTSSLFQFPNFFDFGAEEDNTPLNGSGEIEINGNEASSYYIYSYLNNETITIGNLNLLGTIFKLKKGFIVYSEKEAVIIDKDYYGYFFTSENGDVLFKELEKEIVSINLEDFEVTIEDASATFKIPGISGICVPLNFDLAEVLVNENTLVFKSDSIEAITIPKDTILLIDDVPYLIEEDYSFKSYDLLNFIEASVDGNRITLSLDSDLKDKIDASSFTLNGIEFSYDSNANVITLTYNGLSAGRYIISASNIKGTKRLYDLTLDTFYTGSLALIVDKEQEPYPAYSASSLFQLSSFNDFGVPSDNTELSFFGDVMVDGIKAEGFTILGYASGVTTITFNNINHYDKSLYIPEGFVIYYNGHAVILSKALSGYYSSDGKFNYYPEGIQSSITLLDKLVSNSTTLSFNLGIDGEMEVLKNPDNLSLSYSDGTLSLSTTSTSATISKGLVLKISSTIYVVSDSIDYVIENGVWVRDMSNIPEDGVIKFKSIKTESSKSFTLTILSTPTVSCDFLADGNGSTLSQTGNILAGYFSYKGADGTLFIYFNSDFTTSTTYTLSKGSKFILNDGSVMVLDHTYNVTYDGTSFTLENLYD